MTLAVSVFKKNNLYSTRERRRMLDVLAASDKPLTAKQLHERMGTRSCDLATVHRTLKRFVRAGIVHSISFNGRSLWYERRDVAGHHHHVFCTSCGRIEDIPLCHVEIYARYAKTKWGYEISSHSLELLGLCPECALRNKINKRAGRAKP